MGSFCHGKKTNCLTCYRYDSCVKLKNPFGLCIRTCDLHSENCGHCTAPLQCGEWKDFWLLIEQEWAEHEKKRLYYDPWPDCPLDGCEACDDVTCPQRREPQDLCDYSDLECIDEKCRRLSGCAGCEILAPPPKAELEEEAEQ